MIRIVRARRLAALAAEGDRAKARVAAVQRRLASLKSERDRMLADFDKVAVLAQEQAARLENDIKAEAMRSEELAADLARLGGSLAAAQVDYAALRSQIATVA